MALQKIYNKTTVPWPAQKHGIRSFQAAVGSKNVISVTMT